jgi:protein TonB
MMFFPRSVSATYDGPPTPAPSPTDQCPAQFIKRQKPLYPDLAKIQNIQGDVTVRVTVGILGQVLNPVVTSSSGSALLDQAALKAAMKSTFVPMQVDGKPFQCDHLIHYTFSLGQ